ncbi:MAG: hypothetical protein ABEK42_01410, partial [Thiohalorhabdaceae bacterium]
ETVRDLAQRLQDRGVQLTFSSLKHQVREVFDEGGLVTLIGEENFFWDKGTALKRLQAAYG